MSLAEGIEKIEELERRYKVLGDQSSRLNRGGVGFWQDLKAEIE